MIIAIISNIILVIGVFLGEAVSSLVYKKGSSIKEILVEVLVFIIIINLLMSNILTTGDVLVQLVLYFVLAFVSIVSTRTLLFLLFRSYSGPVPFKAKEDNKRIIRLAYELVGKYSKQELLNILKKAGYSSSVLDHLNKVLKE